MKDREVYRVDYNVREEGTLFENTSLLNAEDLYMKENSRRK